MNKRATSNAPQPGAYHGASRPAFVATGEVWCGARYRAGFYYDIDLGDVTISETDFGTIEKEMRRIIARDLPFTHRDVPVDEAIAWAKETDQPYKVELLNDLKRSGTTIAKELAGEALGSAAEGESKVKTVSLYSQGDYTDLCRGGHVESTGKVGGIQVAACGWCVLARRRDPAADAAALWCGLCNASGT